MNIKQASEQSGVSAPNIRFYEKEGLWTPARRQAGNDYRDYTAGDVRTLRFIRMLRMLDVPLPVIRSVLAGDAAWGVALREQKTALEQRAKQLEGQPCVFVQNWPGRTRLWHHWMWTPACPGWRTLRSRRTFSAAGCRITARWRRCSIRNTFSLSRRQQHQHAAGVCQRPCRRMQRNTDAAQPEKEMMQEFFVGRDLVQSLPQPGQVPR